MNIIISEMLENAVLSWFFFPPETIRLKWFWIDLNLKLGLKPKQIFFYESVYAGRLKGLKEVIWSGTGAIRTKVYPKTYIGTRIKEFLYLETPCSDPINYWIRGWYKLEQNDYYL